MGSEPRTLEVHLLLRGGGTGPGQVWYHLAAERRCPQGLQGVGTAGSRGHTGELWVPEGWPTHWGLDPQKPQGVGSPVSILGAAHEAAMLLTPQARALGVSEVPGGGWVGAGRSWRKTWEQAWWLPHGGYLPAGES